ncbi:MAG: tRNA (guanine-N1)-methyltransferase [Thaumarchaeota archaeon]|nr:tRNA (guanine-N1)-methyltransferase [Nitrososphaerota archaeon]MCY3975972.1 tRNA (guanine-N1)-methyltransferase [Nitrososphaerota archaeon]
MYNIKNITEIVEGNTKIIVPTETLNNIPSSNLKIFFNPKASINRDFSIIAYSAFAKRFNGPKIFLDSLCGVGARGLRVANEIKNIKVIANDMNNKALELSLLSAHINNLNNYYISNNEACNFLSMHAKKHKRGMIVDIDPFGSSSKYIDCGIRATMHGGLLSMTSTDLQVLHGIFKQTCKRKYYGVPIKTTYSNEISIRLILGSVYFVSSRLDITIVPMLVENNFHYYRIYVKILNKPDNGDDKIGYILHCQKCGNREIRSDIQICSNCKNNVEIAGPLWIGKLFDEEFVISMLNENYNYINRRYYEILKKCLLESNIVKVYFTSDEIASTMHMSPLKLNKIINILHENNFIASPTSLNQCGFRTDAKLSEIVKIFQSYK